MNQVNQTTVVLKLLNGTYQLTKLNLKADENGAVRIPLTINTPVYNEGRKCRATFYKKNSRNTMFYKEVNEKAEDNKLVFA